MATPLFQWRDNTVLGQKMPITDGYELHAGFDILIGSPAADIGLPLWLQVCYECATILLPKCNRRPSQDLINIGLLSLNNIIVICGIF